MRLGARSSRWEIEFFFFGAELRVFHTDVFVRNGKSAMVRGAPAMALSDFFWVLFLGRKYASHGAKGSSFFQSSASTAMDCSPAVLLLLLHFLLAVK